MPSETAPVTAPRLSRDSSAKIAINVKEKDLAVLTAKAWSAVESANEPPFLFRFGGLPGRFEYDDAGEPVIHQIKSTGLRHILARVAKWHSGPDAAFPPSEVVSDMLATPNMPLPKLLRIVRAPVFASDGSIETQPGYHAANQTYYEPARRLVIPELSRNPMQSDIASARRLICDELLGDFPFAGPADISHAVGFLLLPFVRGMINGPTPLHLFDKPAPGSGATLLADVLSFPSLGQPLPTMSEGGNDSEWRKRLTAKLRKAPTILAIDNVRSRIDSGALASAITAPCWEDRILQTSAVLAVPVRVAWLANGNNLATSIEIARRSVYSRLDAKMGRPWLRTEFRHPELQSWTRRNRPLLIWSALTLIQAWIAVGRPQGTARLGMFENWSAVIGGILDVAGIEGFLGNLQKFYDADDEESATWTAFIEEWWARFQEQPHKVAALLPIAREFPLELGEGSDHSQIVRLSGLLTRAKDTSYRMMSSGAAQRVQLCQGERTQRSFSWQLRRVGA